MKVWKDYATEHALVVIEKVTNARKPKTVNSCWRKLCPGVSDFTGFTAEPGKEIMEEIVDTARGGRRFQVVDPGEIQALIDTSPRVIN